jgi:hypothetical protein
LWYLTVSFANQVALTANHWSLSVRPRLDDDGIHVGFVEECSPSAAMAPLASSCVHASRRTG